MTDELDRLKQSLKQAQPRPNRDARQQAMQAAMTAFDEEFSTARQGSGVIDRLKGQAHAALTSLKGRTMTLTQPNLKYILAGGVSFAALSIAIINFDQLAPRITQLPEPADVKTPVDALRKSNDAPASKAVVGQKEEEFRSAEQPPAAERGRSDLRDQTAGSGQRQEKKIIGDVATRLARPAKRKTVSEQDASVAQSAPLRSVAEAPAPVVKYQGRDKFAKIDDNPVKLAGDNPVSTFSIDVDTASYSFMRSSLNNNVLPPKDAVRVEELINYFPYDYAAPAERDQPFRANVSVTPSPWNADRRLLHIGIKGFELKDTEKPAANLVFLIDTSGSMNDPDKLPLLVRSFKLLLSTLKADDRVSIVTYAGSAGTVLEPTRAADKAKILAALEQLGAGGSTAGGEGIRQAYRLAGQHYLKEGVNRVILATDGDFNVGISDPDELKGFVERRRNSGIELSVLGFGRGNYNDQLMQALAQNGNGNAAYIDTLGEARKVLVDQAGSTLFTIAKDVKIQVEFNPARVSEYRLIGYETRQLKREDFNNDKVDAGDIGSGHTVTAIYEFLPKGAKGGLVEQLRYGMSKTTPTTEKGGEYAFLKLRYKLPGGDTSRLITRPVTQADAAGTVDAASDDTRFATAVAGFGQLLRGGQYTGDWSYGDVLTLARGARGEDEFGYRAEFLNLVRLAQSAAALEPLKK